MATTNFKVGQNYIVQQSTIYYDLLWNSRGNAKAESSGDEGSYTGIRENIRVEGQDTPVVVRASDPKNPKHKGKELQLVSGFRRFQALLDLHNGDSEAEDDTSEPRVVKGLKKGEIRVQFEQLTDAEARRHNVRENTARDSLSAPDIAYGIADMVKNDPGIKTQEDIALAFGIGQSYAGRLLKISQVKPGIFADWRGKLQMARLPIDQMKEIADLPKEDQEEAYSEACAAMSVTPTPKGPKGWIPGSVAAAKELGQNMGYAKHDGTLNLSPGFFKLENLSRFVKIKVTGKGAASENEQQNILSAFEDAYELACKSGSPKPEAPLTDEEKKAKREAAKAAKAAAAPPVAPKSNAKGVSTN